MCYCIFHISLFITFFPPYAQGQRVIITKKNVYHNVEHVNPEVSSLEKETQHNGVDSPSQFEHRRIVCLRNYSVSLFLTLLPSVTSQQRYPRVLSPCLFLHLTRVPSGLPSGYTLHCNISAGWPTSSWYHFFHLSFLSNIAITIHLSHFKSSVSAMSSFPSYYCCQYLTFYQHNSSTSSASPSYSKTPHMPSLQ